MKYQILNIKNQKHKLNIKNLFSKLYACLAGRQAIRYTLYAILAIYCLLFTNSSPVLAQLETCLDQGYTCCSQDETCENPQSWLDNWCPANHSCCESCTPIEGNNEDGITNPVIGLFGKQAGNITLAYLLAQFLRVSLVAAGILLLIYLIISGIQWLTSGGEKTAVAAARERMTAAFIGLIIIVLVIVVINLINNIFGLNILEPELPTP